MLCVHLRINKLISNSDCFKIKVLFGMGVADKHFCKTENVLKIIISSGGASCQRKYSMSSSSFLSFLPFPHLFMQIIRPYSAQGFLKSGGGMFICRFINSMDKLLEKESSRSPRIRLKSRFGEQKWGHPLKGESREKTPPRCKKIHFFSLDP